MTDQKPFVACGCCGVKISPVIGCNTTFQTYFRCSRQYNHRCKRLSDVKQCKSFHLFCFWVNWLVLFLAVLCNVVLFYPSFHSFFLFFNFVKTHTLPIRIKKID